MSKKKNQSKIWAGLSAVGLFLLSKLKFVFALLKVGKFATLISMFISFGAYAIIYGWKFGVALVYLLFVHEMGHLLAAKQIKLPTSPAIFIPFLGAAVGMKKMPDNAKDEAYIAYAGPLFGLLSILPAVVLYEKTGYPLWGLMISLGATINLFNLFPVSPLDGGRIVGVLSPKIWLIGLICIIPILILSPDPIIFLIFLFGLGNWWRNARRDYAVKEGKQTEELLVNEQEEARKLGNELKHYQEMPNFAYIVDHMMDENRVSKDRLIRNLPDGWMLPFFHDKKKLKKDAILTKISLLEKRERLLLVPCKEEALKEEHSTVKEGQQEKAPEQFINELISSYEESLLNEKENVQNEIEKMKNYYVASMKTKVTVLVLYLLLAGSLSYFVVYGNTIMKSHLIG